MESFWNIVSRWSGEGQGFFLLVVIFGVLSTIRSIWWGFVTLVRGYDPKPKDESMSPQEICIKESLHSADDEE